MENEKNNQLKIIIYGYDVATIEETARLVSEEVSRLKLDFSGPLPLPVKRQVVTVPISPHKHKDAQEQFIRQTHRRVIHISAISSRSLGTLSAKLKVPNTVGLKLKSSF
jgi:small subunit ribosomal protein S10